VIICYFWSAEWPEARRLLAEHAPDAESVWTGGDDYHYWRETAARWGHDDLVTIEQDNGIHAGVIPGFEACPEPWCSFGYEIGGSLCVLGGGCRKLSLDLQKQVSLADILYPVRDIGECPDCAALCWRHMDTRISAALQRAGCTVHVHEPPIRHLRAELGLPQGHRQ
jgi:hypothetical protein